MGVPCLWTLLKTTGNSCSSESFSNVDWVYVAIDFSLWKCQASFVSTKVKSRSITLMARLLFNKICNFLRRGFVPYIVFEGTRPEIKRRRESFANGSTSWDDSFKLVLSSLGVPFAQAPGEAEAFCAHLNMKGIVEAVVTEDADAFLFGAKVVLRQVATKADEEIRFVRYDADDIKRDLGLRRCHLVSLAALSGCDYTSGLPGVGPQKVLDLIDEVGSRIDLVQRVLSWPEDEELRKLAEHNCTCVISKCEKKDCRCDWHVMDKTAKARRRELQIYRKYMAWESNDFRPVTEEFLKPPTPLPEEIPRWSRPSVAEAKRTLRNVLRWDELTCERRLASLLFSWSLYIRSRGESNAPATPLHILRRRVKAGTEYFQLQWRIAELSLLKEEDCCSLESTSLIERLYPQLVLQFNNEHTPKDKSVQKNKLLRYLSVKKSKEASLEKPDQDSEGTEQNSHVADGSGITSDSQNTHIVDSYITSNNLSQKNNSHCSRASLSRNELTSGKRKSVSTGVALNAVADIYEGSGCEKVSTARRQDCKDSVVTIPSGARLKATSSGTPTKRKAPGNGQATLTCYFNSRKRLKYT